MRIYYEPRLKQLARNLRNQSTLSEILLWNELKGRRIKGYQFMRQKPIGKFIADFFCSELKLVLEIDGASHANPIRQLKDEKKDGYLNSLGITVLRYDDDDVKTDISGVIDHLVDWIEVAEEIMNGAKSK